MISKLILSIIFSISLRTANIQPNSNDYEYMLGIDNNNIDYINILTERENGTTYNGFDLKIDKELIIGRIFYKEAQNIDNQSLSILFRENNLRYGFGILSKHWNQSEGMINFIYGLEYLSFDIKVNNNRVIIDSKLFNRIDITNKLYIEPLIKYYIEDNPNNISRFWQAKILMGYKL